MGFNTVMSSSGDLSEEDKIKRAMLNNAQGAQDTYNATSRGQSALANALTAQMSGAGPNLADQQLKQATNRNISQGAGMIASQKGISPALAARLVANQTASANQEAAGQSGIIRSQQQLGAQGQLGNVLGQQQQGATQNLGESLGYLKNRYNTDVGAAGERAKLDENRQESQTKSLLGGVTGVASLFSDERVKKDITDANRSSYDFLDKIGAHKYKYKDKAMGEGEYISPMAQELEETSQGKDLVEDTPAGKVVDMGHAAGLLMANQAALHERLKHLEKPHMAEGGGVMDSVASGLSAAYKSMYGEDSVSKNSDEIRKNHKKSLPTPVISPYAGVDPNQHPAMLAAALGGELMRTGGKVHGRAPLPGDHPENDIVDAKLSPGEIVLPRSISQHPEAPEKAAEFVRALKKEKGEPKGFSRVLHAKRKTK